MPATRQMLLSALAASLVGSTGCARADTSAAGMAFDSVALYHRFSIPAKVAWGAISIDLAPGGWRVGRIDGPVATEAQLRSVLASLGGIEIGGRCASWAEAGTAYPCGFALRDLDLAGVVADRFGAMTADLDPPSGAERISPTHDNPQLRESGLISPVLQPPRFVALRVPTHYLGDKGAAFGGKLAFGFRAVSNSLVPSEFDRSSGAVILRAAPRVAPGPSST